MHVPDKYGFSVEQEYYNTLYFVTDLCDLVREGTEFNHCHSNGKAMFHLKKNRCHLVVCCISSLQGERRGEKEGRGGERGEERRGEERRGYFNYMSFTEGFSHIT